MSIEPPMIMVTLHRQGDASGFTLPEDIRIRLGLEVGQELTLVEIADGLKLVKTRSGLDRQLRLAREVVHEQAEVLQELSRR